MLNFKNSTPKFFYEKAHHNRERNLIEKFSLQEYNFERPKAVQQFQRKQCNLQMKVKMTVKEERIWIERRQRLKSQGITDHYYIQMVHQKEDIG